MPSLIKYKSKLLKYIDKLLTMVLGNRKNSNAQSHIYKTIGNQPSISSISNTRTEIDEKSKQITSNVDKENEETQYDITKRVDYLSSTKSSKFDISMSSNKKKRPEVSDAVKQMSEQPTQIFVDKSEPVLPNLESTSSISKDKTQILISNNNSISKDKTQILINNNSSISKDKTKILVNNDNSINKDKTQILVNNNSSMSKNKALTSNKNITSFSKQKTQVF